VNIFSDPFEKGEVLFPDTLIRQLNRLDIQMLREGLIIPHNTVSSEKAVAAERFHSSKGKGQRCGGRARERGSIVFALIPSRLYSILAQSHPTVTITASHIQS
jgi:hypothetical protein